MGYGALAQVTTGWTGTIYVDAPIADVEITITPYTRESVASLLMRLAAEFTAKIATMTITVDSSGVVTLDGGDADIFSVTFTGTCESRTGFTAGPYSGDVSYTAAAGYTSAWVPAAGLKLDAPMLDVRGGGVTGDDGLGSAWRQPSRRRLTAWTQTLTLPTLTGEWDYWHDGRMMGRFSFLDAARVPMSTLRTTTTAGLEFNVVEVT